MDAFIDGGGTHTFFVNGVYDGASQLGYRYEGYKKTSSSGSWISVYSDSNIGHTDPDFDTYVDDGYIVKLVIYNSDWILRSVYYWYVYDDDDGPSWSIVSVDLASSDDTAGESNSDNITSKSSGLTFSWPTATDSPGTGVNRYEWRVGTSGAWNNRDLNTSVDISAGEGTQTFYVRAVDNSGNPSSAKSLSFTVDTTKPNVPTLSSTQPPYEITDTTPYFNWSGSDNSEGSGIWRYRILVEYYTGVNLIDEWTGSSDYQTPSSQALAAGGQGYDWEVWAVDIAGNTSDGTGEDRFYVNDAVGSVRITMGPANAVSVVGGQWRITKSGYSSGWQSGSATITLSNVPEGNYTLEFDNLSGWTKPANQSISVSEGDTTDASGSYRRILNASWSHPYPTYQYVYEYTSVDLSAEVEGFNQGDTFLFEICEDDNNGIKQVVATVNGTVSYTGGKYIAEATWSAQWEEDGLAGSFGDPEYYFYVSKDGVEASSPNPTVNDNGELVVKPREPQGEITGFTNGAGDWQGTERTVTVKVKNTGNDHANLIVRCRQPTSFECRLLHVIAYC